MLNCLAYLGFHSIEEIETMPFSEYYLRLEAYYMQKSEQRQNLALQAFFNQMVQATTGSDKNPKPKYKNLDDMYNLDDEKANIRHAFEGLPVKKKKADINELTANRWDEWKKIQKERRKRNGRKV